MEAILVKSPYEVSFTGNPMPFVFAISPYGDMQRNSDYKLQVNILLEDVVGSNAFNAIYSQLYFPDYNGTLQMDVNNIIDAYLSFYTPRLSLAIPKEATGQTKRYKITYQLLLADTNVNALNTTAVFYAVKGGINYQQWHPKTFFDGVLPNKTPLHFPAETEKVSLEQKLFFSWLYPYSSAYNQTVFYHFYYSDGSEAIRNLSSSLNFNRKWAVCVAPAGVSQLPFTFPTDKLLVKYQIHVEINGPLVIAQSAFYTIDHRTFYNTSFLLYRNSLGAFTSLRLRGQVEAEAEYTDSKATRISPVSYYSNNILVPQVSQEKTEETYKNTGDTGFSSKDFIDMLRDLFLSPQIYEVLDNKLIPVIRIAKSAKLFTNKDSLFSLQVQWQHAFTNSYYTPATFIQVSSTCPAVETLQVRQVNKTTLQIIYALVFPYDRIRITINNGSTTQTFTYTGNTGSILQPFDNPAVVDDVNITISGQTLCDEETDPISAGPLTNVIVSVSANNPPVAVDDTFDIAVGYNTPVTLSGSAMDNDYDPDSDAIEAIADSGDTTEGGSYTIDAEGVITYLPPSSTFSGTDTFTYQVREVADTSSVSNVATITINVGGISPVYIRLDNPIDYVSWDNKQIAGRYILKFFSDATGSTPLDATGRGITVIVKRSVISDVGGSPEETNLSFTATGTSMLIYNGMLKNDQPDEDPPVYFEYWMQLLANTGYVVI